MKKLIEWFGLFLLLTVPCWPQAGAIASRRYAEKNPGQFSFGAFSFLYPYNLGQNTYIFPDSLIQGPQIDSNNCSATGNFTQNTISGTQTLAVASNVCTATSIGASNVFYVDSGSSYSFAYSSITTFATVNQIGTLSASGDGFLVGLFKDSTHWVMAGYVYVSGSWVAEVNIDGGGSSATVCKPTRGGSSSPISMFPTTPFVIGLTLVGNAASLWIDGGAGGLQQICSGSTSSTYNFQTGLLSGWQTAVEVSTSAATSWEFSNLSTGIYGGQSVADVSPLLTTDGRGYSNGATKFFTGDLGNNLSTTSSSNLIFSVNMLTGKVTRISSIGDNRTGVFNDTDLNVLYDPIFTGREHVMESSWATTVNPNSYYASQPIATDDWMVPGLHAAPASTELTLGGLLVTYWGRLLCPAFNYSTHICSKWQWALSSLNSPPGEPTNATLASNSVGNGFSLLFRDGSFAGYDGGPLIRTATTYGASGVSYWSCFNQEGSPSNSVCYDSAGTNKGGITYTTPSGAWGLGSVSMTAYDNTEYLLSSNNAVAPGTAPFPGGNMIIAFAPKYANEPIYAPMPTMTTWASGQTDFYSSASISLSDTLAGSTICYTMDGSDPAANGAGPCVSGTTYSTPIAISSTTTIKALDSKSGYMDSWITTSVYQAMSAPVQIVRSVDSGNGAGPLTTSVAVAANTLYMNSCRQGVSGAPGATFSVTPASTGSASNGQMTLAWAEWSSPQNVTFTCTANSGGFIAQEIAVCPQCNGTVEHLYTGSGNPISFSGLSATANNFSIISAWYGPTSVTIAGSPAPFAFDPGVGGSGGPIFVGNALGPYSAQTASMSSGGAEGGVLIIADR